MHTLYSKSLPLEWQIGLYEARRFVQREGVVVVGINYRTDIFGGFASRAFAEEHPRGTIGGLCVITVNSRTYDCHPRPRDHHFESCLV
jgi:hypothetical protein